MREKTFDEWRAYATYLGLDVVECEPRGDMLGGDSMAVSEHGVRFTVRRGVHVLADVHSLRELSLYLTGYNDGKWS